MRILISTIISLILTNSYYAEHAALVENRIIKKIEIDFKNRNYSEALQNWQRHEAKYRSSMLFYYWGGMVHLFYANESRNKMLVNYRKGIKLLKKANDFYYNYFPFARPDLENNKLAKRNYINSCFYLALAHHFMGNTKSAIEYSNRILRSDLDPSNSDAWYNLGVYYDSMGRIVEANRAFSNHKYLLEREDEEL